ncbi:hypothetical protein CEXT_426021 [Caerostris extrusa]|uniref:Maturase n=1 Tax=Caerostris extrusa TaxID=172846 RepID=A0AAV4P233_CAEEX|nr:hypothetical protein CEXT_426021 [Caerostris extrusa]
MRSRSEVSGAKLRWFDLVRPLFDHFRILTTFDHLRILTTFDHLRILTTKPLFSDYCIRKISLSEKTPWITREKGWCLSVEGWGTLDHPPPILLNNRTPRLS